ncbi:MAG: hypothetical protein Q9174_002320 [Haloplaca sp. 1 TL-2023]
MSLRNVDQQRRFLCRAAELVNLLNGDTWATRLNQASKDIKAAPFEPQMAAVPFKKREVTTADIDRNLAKTERKNRQTARMALAKAQHKRVLDDVHPVTSTATPLPQVPPIEFVTTAPSRAPLQDVTNVSRTTSGFGAQTHKFVKQRDASNDINNVDDEINNVNTGTDFTLENIDPALRVSAEDILGVQIDSPAGNTGSSLQGASGGLALSSQQQASNEPVVLIAPLNQFIGYLSTVNLVSLSDTSLESRATGNSRDAPPRFLYYYQTEHYPRTFYTALRRDQHQVNYRAEPTLPGSLTLDDVHSVSEAAVPSSAATTAKRKRKRKAADISKASEGFPKPCPNSDICGVTKDFTSECLSICVQDDIVFCRWVQGGIAFSIGTSVRVLLLTRAIHVYITFAIRTCQGRPFNCNCKHIHL